MNFYLKKSENNNSNLQTLKFKKTMMINCNKIGILLLIYNFCNWILKYVYVFSIVSVLNKKLILNYDEVLKYFSDNPELGAKTSFKMGANFFITVLSLTIVFIIAHFLMKINLKEMLTPKKKHLFQAFKWFPMTMMLNIAIGFFSTIIIMFMSIFGVTVPQADFTITNPDKLGIAMQFIYVILLGPVAEEIIYRGIVLTLLKKHGKSLAVIISSLMFGLMHANIPQAIPAFVTGLIYGIIAIQCNSIVPTIIIHILNNVIASYSDFSDVLHWPYSAEIYGIIQIFIILSGLFILFCYVEQLKFDETTKYEINSSQRLGMVFTSIPMIIYFGYLMYGIIYPFFNK